MGTSSSKWSPTRMDGFSLEMVYPTTPLIITEEQRPAFIAFLAALTTGGSRTILITGKADVELSLSITDALSAIPIPFGLKAPTVATKIIPLLGVGISTPITVKGMHNLGGVAHGNLDTLSTIQISATGERSIHGQIVITSPTDVLVHLGDIDLQVWSKDAQPEFLGIGTVENLSLAPGAETYNFILKIDAAIQLDKYYPVKAGLTVSANGFAGSSKNVIVNGVVAGLKFDIVF
ncbi:hypothetical protein EMPS_11164 [Entomortierella parvispora]|uniref:Uncharacterized protein n=1 Tax=Entomortierella parvispora TaxID=205924 RepID=A0A9P3M287_9FUNG|nr:hypothetical protein EMPS_11164 [Entomortierella parvispora]